MKHEEASGEAASATQGRGGLRAGRVSRAKTPKLFRLDATTINHLDALAEKLGIDRTAVVTYAIDRLADKELGG